MCPLWPLHIILLYVLCVMPMLLMANQIPNSINGIKTLKADFITDKVPLFFFFISFFFTSC